MTTSENRIGDWMGLANGKRFWPLDPRADEVDIETIGTTLANLCRFGGRCDPWYSVAQHSLHVMSLVERDHPGLALHALLHDAAEAYLGDVIRPIKPFLFVARDERSPESFDRTEARVMRKIRQAFGILELDIVERSEIKLADDIALATEARDLMGDPRWPGLPEPDLAHIDPLPPPVAKRAFLAAFERLAAMEAKQP